MIWRSRFSNFCPGIHSYIHNSFNILYRVLPITVAGRSKVRTVFALSNTGVVGSIPTRSMGVCVRLSCVCVVLCVGSGLATG
jgi:hypothetical protein